jgi:hypothetical protein
VKTFSLPIFQQYISFPGKSIGSVGMSRNRIILAGILLVVLVAISVTPAIMLGFSIGDIPLAYQLLFDLLQGRLTGFVKLTVKPVVNGTLVQDPLWFIAIHDFTGEENKYGLSNRIVYDKLYGMSVTPPLTYIIKVNRIPIKSTATGKTVYKPVELYVHVATEHYAGGMFVVIEPDQPIKSVEVTVPLYERKPVPP